MSPRPITIDARVRVHVAERVAAREKVHHLVVVEDDEFLGVVCLCDLAVAKRNDEVGSIRGARAVFVQSDCELERAAQMMLSCGIGCLPVMDATGSLVGILTRRDLRDGAFLPSERGVDLCTTCGTGHGLRGDGFAGSQVFCDGCVGIVPASTTSVEAMYFTLGGSG
jgi:signal-transduction protein with cAMP-binding, CBS, and nucleotidyltransferase domain